MNTDLPSIVSEAKEKILNWLTEDNMFRSNIPDDNLYFGFRCVLPLGKAGELFFVVICPKTHSNSVIVQTTMALNPEHFDYFQRLDENEKHDFWHMMLAKLLIHGYMTNLASEQGNVKAVIIQKRLFFSALDQQRFHDAIVTIHLAAQSVATEIRRKSKIFGKVTSNENVDYGSFR